MRRGEAVFSKRKNTSLRSMDRKIRGLLHGTRRLGYAVVFTFTGGRGNGPWSAGSRLCRRSKGRRQGAAVERSWSRFDRARGRRERARTGDGGGSTLETSEVGHVRKRLFQPTRRGGSARKKEQACVGGRSAEAGRGEQPHHSHRSYPRERVDPEPRHPHHTVTLEVERKPSSRELPGPVKYPG